MRINITTTSSKETVNFNYQPMLTRAFHRWLGDNKLHDNTSLYSFSWINGGIANKSGIKFDHGGHFFISAYKEDTIKDTIKGIRGNPLIGSGLYVKEIEIETSIDRVEDQQLFYCASPILVKRTIENKEIHFSFNDPQSDAYLTETLQYKLRFAGLQVEGVSVKFDRGFQAAKTKVVYYKNIGNKTNLCPVIIKGTSEQIAFAWNVGIGNSTGIGFGALK